MSVEGNMDVTKKTILLVEDEVIIAMKEIKLLEKEGYRVIHSISGEDAFDIICIRKEPIDLILMDIDLGKGMDGTMAAQEILKSHDIPVVFLSSHTEKEIVEKTEKITSYGYVVKNSGITVLDASIKMAFKLHHSHSVIEDQKRDMEAANEELQATIEELEATNQEFEAINEQLMKSEEELSESEEKYRLAFKSSPDSININAIDSLYVDINDGFTALTGYTREDVIGRTSGEIQIWAIPEDRNRLIDGLKRAGAVDNLESVFRCKDGSLKTAVMTARIINLKNRPHILSITRDITERKRMENALLESNSLLSSILESTGDGILVVDLNGKIVKYNQRFLEMWRIPEHLAELRDDARLIEHVLNQLKDPSRFLSKVKELYDIPEASSADELAFQDGRVFERYSQPYMMGDNILGRVWSFHDITENKHIEEALQKSENRFDRLTEQNRTMIWEVDTRGTYTYINTVAEKVIGYRPDELIGKMHYYDICPGITRAKLKSEASEIFKERKQFAGMENPILTKDGQVKWVSTCGLPLFNDAGEVCGYLGSDIDISEHKKVRDELRNSEERFRSFFDSSMIGMAITAPDGKLIRINRAFADILGYSVEELNEVNFIVITHPDDIILSQEIARRLLAGEMGSYHLEKRYMTKDGKTIWTDVSIVLIRNDSGSPLNFIITIIDITEKKRDHVALLEASLLNRQIVESAHEGIIVYGKDLRYLVWNPFMESLSGIKADTILGKYPLDVFPFLKDMGLIERLESALRGEIPDPVEFPYNVDGKSGWSVVTNAPLQNANGEIIGVIGTVQDITKRKEAEEALQQSETKYRALIEVSNDVIFCVDKKGYYMYVNHVFASTLGKTPEYFEGKSFWDIYPKEHADQRFEASSKVFETGQSGSVEVAVPLPDKTLYYLAKTNPVMDQDGKVVWNLTHAVDITERKLAENKIHDLLKEKDLILKEVHHRIKNNMTMISSLLELQSDEHNDSETKSILNDAASRVQSMMILYDKLYRSEIDGTMSLKEYLPSLIDEIVMIFPHKGAIKVKCQVDDIILSTRTLSPLGIIINELITNSMKYAFTGRKEGVIIVKASEKKGRVSLIFEDNGIGMPESVSFDNPSGFGLMLVSTLIKQINGSISIIRKKGTKFVIEFPVERM